MYIYNGFMELLLVAIGNRERLSFSPTPAQWNEIFLTSKRQAIAAVMFKGVERLLEEQRPPKTILLQWFALCRQIKKLNAEVNVAAAAVTRRFDNCGIRSCILKGQANALLYPDPYSRTPGDIDILLEGGCEKLLSMARGNGISGEACYHHIDWGMCNGVAVEAHYRPSFMFCPLHNRRLQRWFEANADVRYSNRVSLPDDSGEVAVPDDMFNVVFQLSHLFKHFLQEGIGLRQFMDYYYLLLAIEDLPDIDVTLRRLGLYDFACAVMWVLIDVFGLEKSRAIVPPDSRRGRLVLDEIMAGGNFGKYDSRFMSGIQANALKHNLARLYRDVRLLTFFPSECLCEPPFRLWHWWWRKRHN